MAANCILGQLVIHVIVVPSPHQMSPLHWAAVEGHTNTVKCLVEEGANLNCQDNAAVSE